MAKYAPKIREMRKICNFSRFERVFFEFSRNNIYKDLNLKGGALYD